jgi:hypothetical protein
MTPAQINRRLTARMCRDRAALYEEAAEHLEQCWDAHTRDRENLQFVTRRLRREVDRWEVQAERLEERAASTKRAPSRSRSRLA